MSVSSPIKPPPQAGPKEALSQTTPPPVGCMLFDTPALPGAGWASIEGREPFRVRSTGDLDTSILWITNLGYRDIRGARLDEHPKLRCSDFLRIELQALAREIGLSVTESPVKAVRVLSEIISRVVRLAHRSYGLTRFGRTLKETLTDHLIGDEPVSYGVQALNDAIEEGFQLRQKCEGRIPKGAKIAQFRWSRTLYAQTMVGFPTPAGRWDLLPAVRVSPANVFDYLVTMGNRQPVLCQISVTDVNPQVANLLSFGNGTEVRGWAPVHEVCQLATFGKVTLRNLFAADRYVFLEREERFRVPEIGVVDEVSLSAGLLHENHWMAMAGQRWKRNIGRYTSPRATWMRAWDRMMCLKAALTFAERGIQVISYGLGSVTVAVWAGAYDLVVETALGLQMTPPIWLLEEMRIDKAMQ